MNNKTLLKKLSLLGLLATSIVLTPGIALADRGDRDHSRKNYSHDDRRSHSNRDDYRPSGKRHQGYERYGSVHNRSRGHGHHKNHANYKHRYDGRRHNNYTTYVVNDRYYASDFYIRDPLRFMIGLHTNNIDIILRD